MSSESPPPPASEHTSAAAEEVIRIEPRTRLSLGLKELWGYREMIGFLLVRQVKIDYRQMALGPLWMIIRPAAMALVYTLIFGLIAKLPAEGELPYPLFNYSAVVVWTYFTEIVKSSSTSIVSFKALMEKIYFPRLCVPLVFFGTSTINFLVTLLILFPMMIHYAWPIGPALLLLPVYILLTGMLALGIGLWCAPWVVHYRDVGHALDFVLLGWMYLTPIVYKLQMVPEGYRLLYRLNPMTNIIQGFRWSLLGVGDPPGLMLLYSFAVAVILLFTGALMFRRAERSIVDIA
ncbi:MAG: ABC transporter permease [Planctomycetes bacterium]|nr:ABC transporter permease [Planctomycetota bacterium]